MRSYEPKIAPSSDYYNYSPSVDAQRAFFYPLCTGHFIYEAGYEQHRNSFDSFLLMYIEAGELEVMMEREQQHLHAGQFVLLDCYRPHGYRSSTGWECLWFHFDGPVVRHYYEMIVSQHGNVFSLDSSAMVINKMTQIYRMFSTRETIREAKLSQLISDILTTFLLYEPSTLSLVPQSVSMEEIVSYINEHFREELSVDDLAQRTMLSPYHFIRTFKKETGFTPHEYLINTRIGNAKYLLNTSQMPVKQICFQTGFSCESVFCTSFKKNVGMTPAAYRNQSCIS